MRACTFIAHLLPEAFKILTDKRPRNTAFRNVRGINRSSFNISPFQCGVNRNHILVVCANMSHRGRERNVDCALLSAVALLKLHSVIYKLHVGPDSQYFNVINESFE